MLIYNIPRFRHADTSLVEHILLRPGRLRVHRVCAFGRHGPAEGVFFGGRGFPPDSWTGGLRCRCHRYPTSPRRRGLSWTPGTGGRGDCAARHDRASRAAAPPREAKILRGEGCPPGFRDSGPPMPMTWAFWLSQAPGIPGHRPARQEPCVRSDRVGAVSARAHSGRLESADRNVPGENNIVRARISAQMEPRAVPSARKSL